MSITEILLLIVLGWMLISKIRFSVKRNGWSGSFFRFGNWLRDVAARIAKIPVIGTLFTAIKNLIAKILGFVLNIVKKCLRFILNWVTTD